MLVTSASWLLSTLTAISSISPTVLKLARTKTQVLSSGTSQKTELCSYDIMAEKQQLSFSVARRLRHRNGKSAYGLYDSWPNGRDASQPRECTDEICRTTYPRMLNAGAVLSGLKSLEATAITKQKGETREKRQQKLRQKLQGKQTTVCVMSTTCFYS